MKNILLALICLLGVKAAGNPQIDSFFREYDKPNVPGASVAVFKDGKIEYQKGYGLARVKTGEKATSRTNYRLASLSKQYTAMAILVLVEEGKLRLSDKLSDFFPEFPSYAKNITVDHLVHHQSGLVDYEDHIPSSMGQLTDADVITILKNKSSTYFRPGTQYKYSNSGYCVLSNIVAKVSGKSFPDFMKEKIFEPLGMKLSMVYVKGGPDVEGRAYGHTGSSETDQSQTSQTLGDGGVYTSVEDWFLWDEALYHNPLVSPSLQDLVFTPGKLEDGSSTSYGFGWVVDTYHGLKRATHTGSTIGFRTGVTRFPEKHLTVVVLVNRASSSPWDIARNVADLYLP